MEFCSTSTKLLTAFKFRRSSDAHRPPTADGGDGPNSSRQRRGATAPLRLHQPGLRVASVVAVTSPGMAVQAKAPSSELYEQDLYAWAEAQAALCRGGPGARRRGARGRGRQLYREVRSRSRTIMEQLLKLEHPAATAPRPGWERTIRTERADLAEDHLTPSLRPRVERNLARFYEPRASRPRRPCVPTVSTRPPPASRRPAPTASPRSSAPRRRANVAGRDSGQRGRGERSEHFLTAFPG
jgi:Domain of unknown function DUF29